MTRWQIHRGALGEIGPVVAVDEVVVSDHGTGWGTVLCHELATPPPATLDGAVPGDEIKVTLRTVGNGLVEIDGRGHSSMTVSPDQVIDRVLGWLTVDRLATGGGAFALHASAVSTVSGQVALAVGPAGAGKSTLAAHLVHRGLRLMTDEQLNVLDDGETVTAFARPISLRSAGTSYAPVAVPGDDSVGVRIGVAALGGEHQVIGRAALIVLLKRVDDGAAEWVTLSPTEALRALSANTLDFTTRPSAALKALAALVTRTPCIELSYSRSHDAAGVVHDLLRRPPAIIPTSVQLLEPLVHSDARNGVTWNPGTLTVLIERRSVVYYVTNRSIVELNEAATEVWLSLRTRRASRPGEQKALDLLDEHRLLDDSGDRRRRRYLKMSRASRRAGELSGPYVELSRKIVDFCRPSNSARWTNPQQR